MLKQKDAPQGRSVPGIADQRLSRPEQDHQEEAEDSEHGEDRLLQHDPDHAGPEPGRLALDPGAEGGLARLIDVVPELAELGEPQALVGDPARPVIDHEDESAGQEQQAYQSEKAADHVSPLFLNAVSHYRAARGNSTSSVTYQACATALARPRK